MEGGRERIRVQRGVGPTNGSLTRRDARVVDGHNERRPFHGGVEGEVPLYIAFRTLIDGYPEFVPVGLPGNAHIGRVCARDASPLVETPGDTSKSYSLP